MFTAILTASAALGYESVNTNAGRSVWICATPQPDDLTKAQFEALVYVKIGGVGMMGETGSNTNILTYDTWDTDVDDKAKGRTDAGSPDLEVRYDPDDAGQIIARTAARSNFKYAIMVMGNDLPDDDPASTPTIRYNRGLLTGPRQPNGRNEDFQLDIFGMGLVQRQISVPPVAAP